MADKVVITGATSFLGRYIVDELCKRGMQVYAIIRPSSKNKAIFEEFPNVTTILCDMDKVEIWKAEIVRADYFLHLGWDGVGMEGRANTSIQEKNLRDAITCFNGAVALGCKAFLFAGSQAEYGQKFETITEKTECNPVTEYGKYKLKVCQDILSNKQVDMKYYHTRIFSIYGIGDHKYALVPSCIRALSAGEKMKLSSCKQFWNYMYVTDAAYVICQLLLSGAESGIYNVASSDTRQLSEFVEQIYSLCDKKGTLLFGDYNPKEVAPNLKPNINKLKCAIGDFPFIKFESAIKEMIDLYRNTGEQ